LAVSASDLTPNLIRLEAEVQEKRLVLYVPKYLLTALLNPLSVLQTAPVHVLSLGNGAYRLELLEPTARPLELLASTSMADALARAESRVPLRKKITLVVKKRATPN
jgi:hypothetical protein